MQAHFGGWPRSTEPFLAIGVLLLLVGCAAQEEPEPAHVPCLWAHCVEANPAVGGSAAPVTDSNPISAGGVGGNSASAGRGGASGMSGAAGVMASGNAGGAAGSSGGPAESPAPDPTGNAGNGGAGGSAGSAGAIAGAAGASGDPMAPMEPDPVPDPDPDPVEPPLADYQLVVSAPANGDAVKGMATVRGRAPAFLNVEVWDATHQKPPLAQVKPDADGHFQLTVDATALNTGQTTWTVYAWDSPPTQSFDHTANVALRLTIDAP